MLEHYIDYFEEHFIGSQEIVNMHILGQFRLIGQPDRFVWLRGYENMQIRFDGLQRFFSGRVWGKCGTLALAMLIDTKNVHLLRPLGEKVELTCGLNADSIAAALTNATISLETGMIAIDLYQALPGQREALIDAFQHHLAPAYQNEGIQLRGYFVAEMSENALTYAPVIQNEHEFVVITSYESEEDGAKSRANLAQLATQALSKFLAEAPEALLLCPTLRSPLRYLLI
jgi:quinol monooxygenase YgiN